jgi:hypothetical protein
MLDPRVRTLLIGVRQALIMILGHIEDFLGIERSIIPRHKRGKGDIHEPYEHDGSQ